MQLHVSATFQNTEIKIGRWDLFLLEAEFYIEHKITKLATL